MMGIDMSRLPRSWGKWFLLVSLSLLMGLPASWAVGPGGDVIEEGCELVLVNDSHSEPEEFEILTVNFHEVATPLAISIWLIVAAIAKVLFHFSPLPKYVPESCLLIVIGFIIGGFFLLGGSSPFNAELGTDLFFLYLLPPIMMEAGYFMPQVAFWNNIGSILMFAVIGTLINSFTIGLSLWGVSQGGLLQGNTTINFLECMTFSSLISAVDPVAVLAVFEEIHVNQVLHILVFGESLLNDAVTVVLYRVFETFNEIGGDNLHSKDIIFGIISFFIVAFGGILVGLIFGFLTAFITKYTYKVRVIEPIFVFVMAYMSYIIAEMLTLSSILSIVFCSMFMKPFVEQNISQKSHTTVKYFLKMLSSMSETIIFIFLGTTSLEGVMNDEKKTHRWDTAFVLFTLIFCFVYRSIGVVLQVKVLNWFRLFRINRRSQFIMAYGGIRGAIAFSLVALLCSEVIKAKNIFFTTTVVVIMFTVFVQGMTIKPLVNLLHVQKAEKRKPTMNEEIYQRFNGHLMSGLEEIIGHHGHYSLQNKWEYINEHYLEKILVRERKKAHNYQILDVWKKLAEKEARELIQENKFNPSASAGDLTSISRNASESMLLPQSPAMLEVPNPTEHVSPGQEALETAGGEGTGEEGEARRRKSSFSLHLDAFKKSAYRPRHNFTVRKSRYEIDDDEIAEPKPLAERSLHILHRHKTQRLRQRHTTKTDGKKHGHHHSATDLIRKLRKGGSGTNLAGQNGGAQGNEGKRGASSKKVAGPVPTITITEQPPEEDGDLGITFSVKPATSPNGSKSNGR